MPYSLVLHCVSPSGTVALKTCKARRPWPFSWKS